VAAELNYRIDSKGENQSKEENIETNLSCSPPGGSEDGGAMGGFTEGEGCVPGQQLERVCKCQRTSGVCMDSRRRSKLFEKWVGRRELSM